MILSHECYECSYKGEVVVEGRKVKCPQCGTENDFWLEGEIPPLGHREQVMTA